MTRKRSSLEIDFYILRVLGKHPYGPTKLMYRANLSWLPLKERLSLLMNMGFVSETSLSKGRKVYGLTERGEEALRRFHQLKSFLRSCKDGPLHQAV